jgi:phage-related tail fiber protein
MTSAIESGDPVTTASRGGWCAGINLCGKAGEPEWYAIGAFWESNFLIEIVEVDDEATGHQTKHRVGRRHFREGLAIMARKFPGRFTQVLEQNTDAPCADIFLQCVLFGEEKYA